MFDDVPTLALTTGVATKNSPASELDLSAGTKRALSRYRTKLTRFSQDSRKFLGRSSSVSGSMTDTIEFVSLPDLLCSPTTSREVFPLPPDPAWNEARVLDELGQWVDRAKLGVLKLMVSLTCTGRKAASRSTDLKILKYDTDSNINNE